FLSDPKTIHVLPIRRVTQSIQLRLMCPSSRMVISPPQPGIPEERDYNIYRVPTSATEIFGEGELIYNSGHRLYINGERPQLLLRPAPSGQLERQSGPVFAEFLGMQPARVRVGNAWIQTPSL